MKLINMEREDNTERVNALISVHLCGEPKAITNKHLFFYLQEETVATHLFRRVLDGSIRGSAVRVR